MNERHNPRECWCGINHADSDIGQPTPPHGDPYTGEPTTEERELRALRRAESAPLEAAHITELRDARRAASRRLAGAKEIHGNRSPHTIAARAAHNAISAEISRRENLDDDDRRAAEGDEQRDYAEERYNRELLRDPDPDPLEETANIRAELLEQDRGNTTTAARDTLAAVDELAELRELADLAPRFLAPIVRNAGRRLERLEHRPGTPPARLADAAEELEQAGRALELARRYSPQRRRAIDSLTEQLSA